VLTGEAGDIMSYASNEIGADADAVAVLDAAGIAISAGQVTGELPFGAATELTSHQDSGLVNRRALTGADLLAYQ
jgi:hypothetical protein